MDNLVAKVLGLREWERLVTGEGVFGVLPDGGALEEEKVRNGAAREGDECEQGACPLEAEAAVHL